MVKTTWRHAHNIFYFGLRAAFPDRRTWVESLWKTRRRLRGKEGQPPPTAEKKETEPSATDTGQWFIRLLRVGVLRQPLRPR